MSDLISRQAAIRWVKTECNPYGNPTLDFESGKKVIEHLEQMPSAQPEIIRCKDCRWGRETCGNIECFADINVPPEYHGYEWFCSNGERKGEKNE